MTAPTLVVISYYDRRSTERLKALLASLQRFSAGEPYDLVVVANRTSDAALDMPKGIRVLERENTGMNIGAWDHGWRANPDYDSYLFLQDECYAVREGWLAAYLERAQEANIGLLGESLNPAWDASWELLRTKHAGVVIPDHIIDGRPANRVDVYLDFMRRRGVDPGASGRHLRSLTWFITRQTLHAIDGFPIGANYGECIAAEIAVSRKVEALGKAVSQVSPEEFRYFRHFEYNRDYPDAPFTHVRAVRQPPVSARASADEAAPVAPGQSTAGAVVFRVHSASPLLASTRYRAIMPALGLEERGIRCVVTDRPLSNFDLSASRCIVFAKAFRPIDMELAFAAHGLGVPIVLDLCDDIFIPEYGGGRGALHAATFKAMAEIAEAVVTTGPALAGTVRALAPRTRVTVIPDQLETPDLLARALKRSDAQMAKVTWADRASFALQNPRAALKRARERLLAPAMSGAPALAPIAATKHRRTLIWFGNHGAEHSAFGMGALAPILPHIADAAKRHDLKLLVVSNSRDKYETLMSGAAFATEYREWSPQRIFADLDEADICLIPIPRERFALAKSANRVALALSRGAAVIADDFPALAEFADCVVRDDWAGGLGLYLNDEARRSADIARGQAVIAGFCSAEAVAKRWADLLQRLPKRPT